MPPLPDGEAEARHPRLTSCFVFVGQAVGFVVMFGFVCLVVLFLTGGW